MSDPATTYFLTVEWCNNGHRGVFCDDTGAGFPNCGAPHSEEAMWEILGPFALILSPKSEPFTQEELAEFTYFRPLAEYNYRHGIALKPGHEEAQ